MNEIKQVYLKLADLLGIDGSLLVDFIHQNKQKFMDGEYSAKEFARLIKSQFKLHNEIQDILGKWKDAFSGLMVVNKDLYGIIQRLTKHYVMALVTDAPDLHARLNREKHLYSPFKPLIISCEVGFVKPQPEIFEIALKELKLNASECILIDDIEKNVEVAKAMGFKALQFKDNKQLVDELKQLGVEF